MPERKDSDREVLTSLPRSRPVRRSSKRGDRPATASAARASSKPVAPRKPRAAQAASGGPAATSAATAKRAAGAKPAATAKPAAAPRSAAPKRPAAAKAGAPTSRPRPREAPPRKVPAAGYAAPDGRAGEPTASAGAELITTTIQATAELAQIGLALGRQTLQSMLDRLPKP